MGVSENRGPEYSTLNSRILITRAPKQGPLIFKNSQMSPRVPLRVTIRVTLRVTYLSGSWGTKG